MTTPLTISPAPVPAILTIGRQSTGDIVMSLTADQQSASIGNAKCTLSGSLEIEGDLLVTGNLVVHGQVRGIIDSESEKLYCFSEKDWDKIKDSALEELLTSSEPRYRFLAKLIQKALTSIDSDSVSQKSSSSSEVVDVH